MVGAQRSWLTAAMVLAAAAGCRSTGRTDEMEIPETPLDAGAPPPTAPGTTYDSETSTSADELRAAPRTHTVKRGDSLFQLARLYYAGDIHQWRKILDANRDQIPDKDVLRVGQVLVIPD